METEPILCYVKGDWAYFTTQPLDKQWGDDWNDAPYEHNAGPPYRPHSADQHWEIVQVAWEGDFETPDSWSRGWGSDYSVEVINQKVVPWIQTDRYSLKPRIQIWAGTPLREFIRLVLAGGGMVYMPVDGVSIPTPPQEYGVEPVKVE